MVAADTDSRTRFAKPPDSGAASIVGVLVALAAHVGIPLAVMGSSWLLLFLGLAEPVEERQRPLLLDNVIAAEFVRLGKPLDPKKMPNRKVPPKVKRRPDSVAVSKNMDPEPPKEKDDEENPPDAEDDLLDNLVDRAKAFAEDVEYEQEGDPDGLREGTATEAREGNIYLGKLVLFLQKGWTVPNTISAVEGLKATIEVEIDASGRVRGAKLLDGSGDPLFDQSIEDRIHALIQVGATIPPPPVGMESQFYGRRRPVRFSGANVRR